MGAKSPENEKKASSSLAINKNTENRNFLQVILLSASFMLIFTAFQTTGIIEESVLQSIRNESTLCLINETEHVSMLANGQCPSDSKQVIGFNGNGYTSLSIIYALFSIASWIAPSIVTLIKPKWSMIFTSLIFVAFIGSFLFPMTWLLYTLSALLGAAAAILWTAQGTFLSWVSNSDTITRNSGIFWSITQCSLFFGNLLVYWQLRGKTSFDSYLRSTIFIPLTIIGIIGVFIFCCLKNLKSHHIEKEVDNSPTIESEASTDQTINEVDEEGGFANNVETGKEASQEVLETAAEKPSSASTNAKLSILQTAAKAFVESLKLFSTKHMLLLSLCSIYSGLEFSFLSGVYSTAVGNTKLLGNDSKKYVGLVGILTGIGEVLGGSLFGLLGSRTTRKGRTPIVLLGAVVHFISFTSIYFNIPNEATLQETNHTSFFEMPSSTLALICAILLGFGDACLQTQLIAIFASVYQDKSSAAFAIFKFTQSAASAAAFYTSTYTGVFLQMIILFVSCVVSSISFFVVEWQTSPSIKKSKTKEDIKASQPEPKL